MRVLIPVVMVVLTVLSPSFAHAVDEDPVANLRSRADVFAKLPRPSPVVMSFCVEAAQAYEAVPARRQEVAALAASTCMRHMYPHPQCDTTPELCGRIADRDRTVEWLSLLPQSGFTPSDLQVLAVEREKAKGRALARSIRAGADNPPSDGPCGALGGYRQLLTQYAPVVEQAKQADAGTTPETDAVRYLQEKAALFQRNLYRTVTGIRDRHVQDPAPEQLDEEVKWFDCLGDYRDSRAEAAKAKALAAEARARAAEDERCDKDPACRAKRAAEAKKREVQDLVDEICGGLAERRGTKASIANEHRYARAAGVVNLRDLQDFKETLQDIDERIADRSAQYRQVTGKAFSPKLCR